MTEVHLRIYDEGFADGKASASAEIARLRSLIVLGDFTNLRPNSDSFKLVQQIRREQSAVEQAQDRKP